MNLLRDLQWDDDEAIRQLQEFVRIPGTADRKVALLAAAEHAEQLLESVGFRVWRRGEEHAPVLFAEIAGSDDRWLLFYNHYDVTSAGDERLWTYPPYSAQVADERLYGRGSSDHKASFVARVLAIKALVAQGALPVGIRFIVDGEEESGSPSLERVLREHGHELRAVGGIYSGGALDEGDRPVIRAGSKGMCSLRLVVRTAGTPLHSKWAAIVPNPSWRLLEALHSMYDSELDKVLIDGFYDDVVEPNEREVSALEELDFAEEAFTAASLPVRLLGGGDQQELLRRLMFAPTFNIAQFSSGTGGRTVLPHEATAILDVRLVPWQDSQEIEAGIRRHLTKHGFDDVLIESLGGGNPDKCDLADPVVVALKSACREVYGDDPQVHPSGAGSGPRYLFREYLGISLVQDPGASWLGSSDHGIDENVRVRDYLTNIRVIAAFIRNFAAQSSPRTCS